MFVHKEYTVAVSKKDAKTKEEAVRTHWATDSVHETLHSYYKLASNLMDRVGNGISFRKNSAE
jgi:hypothetical protein